MIVIKRDGRKVEYDSNKIVLAISSANKDVKGKEKLSRSGIEEVIKDIESQEKVNESLTMKVNELKSLANIDVIAENEGLSYNSDNIIVITN